MNKTARTLAYFWRFTRPYAFMRTLALLFPLLATVFNALAAPYVLSLFINQLQAGTITIETSMPLILSYGALLVFGELVFWRLALYFCWTFEIHALRDIYMHIFRTLSHQSLDFHADRFGGSMVSQSSKFLGAFERFWDMIIWTVVPMLTSVIGSIAVLAYLGLWPFALFLIGFSVLFACVVMYFSRFLAARNTVEAQASTKTNGYLADMVTNILTVKSFGKEDYEADTAKIHITDWLHKSFRLKWGVIYATSAFSVLLAIVQISALVFAVLAVTSGAVEIGTIYLVFTYTLAIGQHLWKMNEITRGYNKVLGDSYDMTCMLDTEPGVVDGSESELVATSGSIDFSGVQFAHDKGAGEQVYDDFDLNIPAGQRVGLVGRSGSGKTTLTRVLLRFSDIQQGSVAIDGQDIAHVTQQSLHDAVAYVPQEPLLFHRSLQENIAYAKPDADEASVIAAAKKANAWEFISQLPQGLNTVVGERGVKLSGGQRQRIAIARAILKDAPILVLDEATSALDSESEKLIQASLDQLMKDRTSIVIAHRLSTIAKLDRIIVLDEGEIVEDGSHAELLQLGGTYAKLWRHQSGGFIEE